MEEHDPRSFAIQKLQLVRRFAQQDKEPCEVLPGLYIGNHCLRLDVRCLRICLDQSVQCIQLLLFIVHCRPHRCRTKRGVSAEKWHHTRPERQPSHPVLSQKAVPVQKVFGL